MKDRDIKARIAGREYAWEAFDILFVGEATVWEDHTKIHYAESFLKELALLLPHKQGTQEPEKMAPIQRLGRTIVHFKTHAGSTFDETPIDYLENMLALQETFCKKAKAYLNHPDIKARRG